MGRIRAQRPGTARERRARGHHGVRRGALFHPIDHRAQHVEGVCRLTATAVAHAGHQKEAAPRGHLIHAAVVRAHLLVVVDGVQCGEPRVAGTVIEEQLAAVRGERAQICPPLRVANRPWISRQRERFPVHIHLGRQVRWTQRTWSGAQQAWNAAPGGGDPGVIQKPRIDLTPSGVLGTGERRLDCRGLLWRQAQVCLRTVAGERRDGIEIAGAWVQDHTVLHAILRVADLEESVDDQRLVTG